MPTGKIEVVNAATPLASATGAARLVAPLRNSTVPVGLLPVTVAVNVTACPAMDGLSDDTAVVLEGLGEMVSLNPADVLPGLEASPL